MSGSTPLVLSCGVLTADDFHYHYSLSKDDAVNPEPPPSRHLSIASRCAVGVYPSNDADGAVNALRFETRLADAPALSHLTVRGEGAGFMCILAVDENLVILESCFQTYQSPVYLVYDAVELSITMIPSHPWLLTRPYVPGEKRVTAAARSVLIARPPGDDYGRSYALVNMAVTSIHSGYRFEPDEKQDVLYVWRSSSQSPRWDLTTARFPPEFKGDAVDDRYTNVMAFTGGGHAFWANLPHGAMYCSLDALLSASNGGPKLELGFIGLPIQHPCRTSCAVQVDSDMYQTIGRAGESSVKFVTIDGFVQLRNFVDCTVRVWSLSPHDDMTRWTEQSLCLGSLTEQDEFKKAGLPTDMVPAYPGLSAEEDDVVYLMLGKYKKCCHAHRRSMSKVRCKGYIPAVNKLQYHLRVDMRRGVLLACARLPDETSPSVLIASTSVVPTKEVMDRHKKRRRGDRKEKRRHGYRKKKRRRGDAKYIPSDP